MQWPIAPTTPNELMELEQHPFVKFEIELVAGVWIDLASLGGKSYLLDFSFTTGGARLMPEPIAGEFSAEINNPGNIFHPYHGAGHGGYFRAGRRVRISLGNHFASGDNDWQRIIGYMDEPQFSSKALKLNISGLDYMRRLADMKFTKEVIGALPGQLPTPIDNYWGAVKIHNTVSTTGGLGVELYQNGDAMQYVTAPGVPPGETVDPQFPASPKGWTKSGVSIGFSGFADVGGGSVFVGNIGFAVIAEQWVRNLSVCTPANLVQRTKYRFDFKYQQVAGSAGATFKLYQPPHGTCDGGSKLLEPGDNLWHSDHMIFTALANAPLAMQISFHEAVGQWKIDQFQIRKITPAPWHKYDMSGLGCTGIYHVELDEGAGAGFQPVWAGKQGSPGEGWYYDDAPGNEQFYFDEDRVVPTAAANLRIYYFARQQAQSVLADILVKAYPTVFVAVGPASARDAAMLAMQSPWTGVGIDRVWFNAGSTYIDAIRMLCERCNYRFYFNWNGDPRFVPAPTPAAVPIFIPFLPKHINSPQVYQNISEIWNRIVIQGEKVAELTGWEENMPSELKDELNDPLSIAKYGERTKNITNHLFQDLPSITAMCKTLLDAHKIPKWYIDFETPYNVAPMAIGDTIQVEEYLDILLADVVHICLIREEAVSLHNVTYKCEIKMPT